ncbi:MAG: CPBP family intramembrane glutamic endopeptidase [Bacteroidota bacterium]
MIFIGIHIGYGAAAWLLGSQTGLAQQPPDFTQAYRESLLATQAIIASSALIGAPLLYWHFIEQKQVSHLFQWRQDYAYPMLLAIGLAGSCMVVNDVCTQWNMALKLPAFLADFEQWAHQQEAEIQRLTALLATCYSTADFLKGLLVLALLPAVGEELLFRGMVQGLFRSITKNIHVAICLSAFIFSAVHLQFYGLVPRFLLGVLLGYLYAWTQDLAFPIAAHFFNNAFVLLVYQQGWDTPSALPVFPIALCAAISIALASTLRRHSKKVHA